MHKFIMSFRYCLRMHWSMTLWYLAIYSVTIFIVSLALIETGVISPTEGSLIYRIWGAVIFLFAISIRFREDFDFLLTLSSTRRDIWAARLITALGFSAFFSLLIVIERVLVDHFNHTLGFTHITDPFHFFAPYAAQSLPALFVYFLTLNFCCAAAGLFLGSLFYRWGRKFILIFWLVFSALPMIVLPFALWRLYQQDTLSFHLTRVGGYLQTFDVLNASGLLFLVALFFGVATFVNMRSLPQQ